jgi:glycine/D-amino acid oxidase-like deaminating enzyme
MHADKADVVIVGGGIIGSCAAPTAAGAVLYPGDKVLNPGQTTGHNTMGMTLGPVTGQLVSDLITQHKGAPH